MIHLIFFLSIVCVALFCSHAFAYFQGKAKAMQEASDYMRNRGDELEADLFDERMRDEDRGTKGG